MVIRQIFECKTCKTKIMIRTQASALKEHPINIYCGKCNSLISGKAVFNPECAQINIELDAKPSNESYPLYEIELSAEFITEKLIERKTPQDVQHLSPFMRLIAAIGHEGIKEFERKISNFVYLKETDWKDLKRINELWLNGKEEYLENELRNYLPKKQFPANNKLEYIRGIHYLNLLFFNNILKKDYFKETASFLHKEIDSIVKNNSKNFFEMVKYFADNGFLENYDRKIFDISTNFVNIFEQVIPAFALEYCDKPNLEQMGITTASFDDLKQFYIDAYEDICVVIDLLEALNNIKHRNDYNVPRQIRRDVTTFNDFQKLSKAIKLNDFINGQETFDRLIFPKADNQIRNAIGHKSYSFDGLSQQITYYPKGKIDNNDKKQIYIIELALKCIDIFQCALNLSEMVYQIRKIEFVQKGCIPVSPDVFSSSPSLHSKVGRNDKCPCGSGLKYKKCCGK